MAPPNNAAPLENEVSVPEMASGLVPLLELKIPIAFWLSKYYQLSHSVTKNIV